MKAHEAMLVQEHLAGDRVEELYFKLRETAARLGASIRGAYRLPSASRGCRAATRAGGSAGNQGNGDRSS
jgi:hypothetical protein